MSNGNTAHRPVGVTILVVLLWIEALIAILAGVFLIAENNDPDLLAHVSESSDTLLAFGIAALIVGLITALVAGGLGRGGNFARTFAGVITFIHLLGNIYSFFALDGVTRGSAAVSIVVALVVLYILYGEKGTQEFFARR